MNERPQAATDGVIAEALEDGAVLYDVTTQQAHSLDATAYRVWAALDGHRSVRDLARELGLDPAAVTATIDQLSARGLIADGGRVSRRRMLRRTAAAGAAAIAAAPVIETVLIPTAAAHASTGSQSQPPPPPSPPPARLNAYINYDAHYMGGSQPGVEVTFPPDKTAHEQPKHDTEYYTTTGGGQFALTVYTGGTDFPIGIGNTAGPQTYVVTVYSNNVQQAFYVLAPGQYTPSITFTPNTLVTVSTAT